MFSELPAGILFGSMFFVIAFELKGKNINTPPFFVRKVLQVGVGIVVGHSFELHLMSEMKGILSVVIVMLVITLGSSIMVAKIIQRMTGWDFSLSMLVSAPAGLSAMTALADTIGSDPFKVSIMHLTRIFTIKMFAIAIILFFSN